MKTGISVVITTRNEEKYLSQAIGSAKSIAQEIVVIDLESQDRSVEVAKKLGAKVFSHKFVNYVEPVRNFGISKATGPWILILDPDEELSPSLRNTLLSLSRQDEFTYFRIPRQNIIFNKWIKSSRWWPDFLIRFFKKGSVNWSDEIHSIPITTGKGSDLPAQEDKAIIHHHYDSVEKYLLWANRYAQVRAEALKKENVQFNWTDIPRKPVGEFLSRYFFGKGYKDGLHGLTIAIFQAFAEFLVCVHHWQLEDFPQKEINQKELNSIFKDLIRQLKYWQSDAQVQLGGQLTSLKARITRKINS